MHLLQAIFPTLMVLALLVPLVTGYKRSRRRVSVILGWALWVLAYFCSDIVMPGLAYHWYGKEAGDGLSHDQPGTMPMILLGWVYPLICHGVGYILAEVTDTVRGLWAKWQVK